MQTTASERPVPLQMSARRSLGLDVARAIAIALVLFCHVAAIETEWLKRPPVWQFAACGRCGVQLFFVLSGFLIGRILIDLVVTTQARAPAVDPTHSLRRWGIFMMRRWLRTLPLYWVVLLLLLLIWPPLFWRPGPEQHILSHFLVYSTMTQNLAHPIPDGWFSVSWSLAVEEWFYLLFSSLLLGMAQLLPPAPALFVALFPFLMIPPALHWWLVESGWLTNNDFVVPVWFDGLAIGVVAAAVIPLLNLRTWKPWVLLAIGLSVVALVWVGPHAPGQPLWRSTKMTVLSLGFSLCLPAFLRLRTLPHWLALPAQSLSRWSYCLYLVHLPLLEMGGYYGPRWHLAPLLTGSLCVFAAFVLAPLSWTYIEQPILARRPAQQPRKESLLF